MGAGILNLYLKMLFLQNTVQVPKLCKHKRILCSHQISIKLCLFIGLFFFFKRNQQVVKNIWDVHSWFKNKLNANFQSSWDDRGVVQVLRKLVKSCCLPSFFIRVWILGAGVHTVLLYDARSRGWELTTQLAWGSILIRSKSSWVYLCVFIQIDRLLIDKTIKNGDCIYFSVFHIRFM